MDTFAAQYIQDICNKLEGNDPDLKSIEIVQDERTVPDRSKIGEFWERIADAMSKNRTIEKLSIKVPVDEDEIDEASALRLAGVFRDHPTLGELVFEQCELDECFRTFALAMRDNKRLNRLELYNCDTMPSLMEDVAFLLNENALESLTLKTVGLFSYHFVSLSESLGNNQSLKELWLEKELKDQGEYDAADYSALFEGISKLIKRNQTFKKLKLVLSSEEVTRSTLSLLAHAATGHLSLEEFHFHIRDYARPTQVEHVGNMIATNTNLRTVALKNCYWDAHDNRPRALLSEVCRGLKAKSCTLKELDLSRNSIDCTDCSMLSEALRQNDSIEKLCLSRSKIGSGGVIILARALTSIRHLVDLDLSRNYFRQEGTDAIACALRSNCGLQKINVSDNPIDSTAITNSLSSNTNLKELCATETFFSQDASNFLLAIKRNTSLERLKIEKAHLLNVMPEVERLLKLNKAGRRALTTNVQPKLWPRILAKTSNDADTLYFFARENPTLFMKQTHLGKRKRGAC